MSYFIWYNCTRWNNSSSHGSLPIVPIVNAHQTNIAVSDFANKNIYSYDTHTLETGDIIIVKTEQQVYSFTVV